MKAFLGSLALLLVAPTLFGAQLTVTVTGLRDPGKIHLAIYESAAVFEADSGDVRTPGGNHHRLDRTRGTGGLHRDL